MYWSMLCGQGFCEWVSGDILLSVVYHPSTSIGKLIPGGLLMESDMAHSLSFMLLCANLIYWEMCNWKINLKMAVHRQTNTWVHGLQWISGFQYPGRMEKFQLRGVDSTTSHQAPPTNVDGKHWDRVLLKFIMCRWKCTKACVEKWALQPTGSLTQAHCARTSCFWESLY